jgi:lipopolysaccharide export system permease protein
MNVTERLSRYFARQFLISFFFIALGVSAVAFTFDLVELLRRSAGKEYVAFHTVFIMGLLKLPQLIESILPFTVLFAGLFTFWRQTKTQELVIARSAGISAWQFLRPALIVAALIGLFQIMVFNTLSAAMYSRFEQLESKYFRGTLTSSSISTDGIWLRQADESSIAIIHADGLSADLTLNDVNIFLFNKSQLFEKRIDADKASLKDGYWQIDNAHLTTADAQRSFVAQLQLPTELNPQKIQDSFASPQTLSFWALPGFISILERAGFSALHHRLYFQAMLAMPMLLCAMVIIAACFSLNPTRMRRTLGLVTGGLITGFLFYVFTNIIGSLGQSGRIPIFLAAWSPAFVCLLLGLTSLLHQEDG